MSCKNSTIPFSPPPIDWVLRTSGMAALPKNCSAMSTKTMYLPPRRISSSNNTSSNNTTTTKRKERDSEIDTPLLLQPTTTTTTSSKSLKLLPTPACSGQLLAGYLAHEFLTRGTLLDQLWDPTETEMEKETEEENAVTVKVTEQPAEQYEKLERYVEVAALLKTDEAQFAGIVNPTQLARFLQL